MEKIKLLRVKLIGGRLNNKTETLFWKITDELAVSCELGDYAIVENANGYDLIQISGVVITEEDKANHFSKTKYEYMKNVIKIISKEEIEGEKCNGF